MTMPDRSPSELRNMFGENLRVLAKDYVSVSDLARRLGINRTQFNRYLSGESFPRPDVLDRICRFFDVDARILLEPVDGLTKNAQLLASPFLADFMGKASVAITQERFPSGFYRFTRRSFYDQNQFMVGLVMVFREGGLTVLRGFETKEAMLHQGLPLNASSREYRGYVFRQEEGVGIMASRRKSMTGSFNYLARVPSFENNFWLGYVTRGTRESLTTSRVARLVYEHLAHDVGTVLAAARSTGYRTIEELQPYHRKLLQLDQPFR